MISEIRTKPAETLYFSESSASRIWVLVAEDDQKVASFIQRGLQEEGHSADVVHTGGEAARLAMALPYDLIILDLMLPERSGLEVLREIRMKKARVPILILTAKGSLEERITGLNAGADDYMSKPFAFAELSARVRALLRRGMKHQDTSLKVGDLDVNTATRQVSRGGVAIDLKPREYALLEFLMRNAHRPVTRTMIIESVWDIHFDSVSNVVDVHINSLRSKIDKGQQACLIRTVRGVGYILSDR